MVHSCFPEKFGIPRQPGLVPEAEAVLELIPPYNQTEAFRGLEQFSHIWVLFLFHECYGKEWKATVRPPRLGGNQRVGVFASRSGFRPNAIGQSVVRLIGIQNGEKGIQLKLGGIDLLDGTPVLDVKPYVSYADSMPSAVSGFAAQAPTPTHQVLFSKQAQQVCAELDPQKYPALKKVISGVLAQDPRPAYQTDDNKHYGMRLWDLNIRFQCRKGQVIVDDIESQNQ